MLLIDPVSGAIVDSNNAASGFYGYSSEQLCSMNISDLGQSSPDAVTIERLRAMELNQNRKVFPHRLANGDIRIVEVLSAPIEIQEMQLLVSIVHDISDLQWTEEAPLKQSSLQELLISMSNELLNLPMDAIESAMRVSLGEMAEFVEADRAYVFDYDFDKQVAAMTHEWCREGIEPQMANSRAIPLATVDEFSLEEHRRGEMVWLPDRSTLLPSKYQELLVRRGVQSQLTIPCMSLNECFGFVGFTWSRHRHTLSGSEQHLLAVFANMLVNIRRRRRLDEALQQKTDEWSTIFEHVPVMLFLVDEERQIQSMNALAAGFAGQKMEAAAVMRLEEALGCMRTSDDPQGCGFGPSCGACPLRLAFQDTVQSGVNHSDILFQPGVVSGKSSEGVHLMASTTRMDVSGKKMVLLCCEDITQRKRSERAAMEFQRRFHTAFQKSPAMMAIAKSNDARYIEVNRAFEQLSGWSRQEVIGRTPLELGLFADESDFRRLRELFQSTDSLRNIESRFRCRSGDDRVGLLSFERIEIDDEPCDLLAILDVTEQRHAEECLAESEKRFRTIADFTYAWEYWMGPDGSLIYVSPSCLRITGFEPKAFYADPALVHRIIHPDDLALVLNHERERKDLAGAYAIEFRIIRRDGKMIWIGQESNRVIDEKGSDGGVRVSNRDITTMRAAEEALLSANARLEAQHAALESKNAALKEVLNHVQEEKDLVKAQITANKEKLILPLLRNLKIGLSKEHESRVTLVERALEDITSSFTDTVSRKFVSLSPREVEVCFMVKNGLSNKEIAECLCVAEETVHKFRQRVRRKLGIANSNVDLATYLRSI